MGEPYDWKKFDKDCEYFEERLGKVNPGDWIKILREYGEFLRDIESSVPEEYRNDFQTAKGIAGL